MLKNSLTKRLLLAAFSFYDFIFERRISQRSQLNRSENPVVVMISLTVWFMFLIWNRSPLSKVFSMIRNTLKPADEIYVIDCKSIVTVLIFIFLHAF